MTDLANKNLLEQNTATIPNEKKNQDELKKTNLVYPCKAPTPYATESGCISCPSTEPYFNL